MIPSLLCCHLPYNRLAEQLDFIFTEQINPEMYLPADALDTAKLSEFERLSRDLENHNLSCTIHAAFMDLNPGSTDLLIRNATRQRVEQTLEIAAILRPKVVVFHPGYSRIVHGSVRERWVENSVSFWQEQQDKIKAAGCRIAIENIFEEEPSTLLQLLEQLDPSLFGHCFDSGHFNMFATVSLEEWFSILGNYIIESHLHDNHGSTDEHLPVDEGEIDFSKVTGLLKQYAPDAIWTLEAHSKERLVRSLKAIKKYMDI